MPYLLHEGGLTVPRGIFSDKDQKSKVADFSLAPSDSLAQMVVDAWVNEDYKKMLLKRENAKALFAERGYFWSSATKTPVVITEDAYNSGHSVDHPNDLVFVLPNHDGKCPPGQTLLETARLLMACTPNGI
jgi:hypothetical protein